MIAYHYNELRFYDYCKKCQLDPRATAEAGHDIYLLPANSTLIEPNIIDGFTPRWNGTTWEAYAENKQVYGYTNNNDGTINYYGHAHTEEELQARNAGVELLFSDTEPVSVNGVYWLSADDPAYIEAKAEAEKEQALSDLDSQYNADKAELVAQYTDSLMHDDEETAEAIKQEMAELDAQYDADYEAIIAEDPEEE
jgi:hypothetical protein